MLKSQRLVLSCCNYLGWDINWHDTLWLTRKEVLGLLKQHETQLLNCHSHLTLFLTDLNIPNVFTTKSPTTLKKKYALVNLYSWRKWHSFALRNVCCHSCLQWWWSMCSCRWVTDDRYPSWWLEGGTPCMSLDQMFSGSSLHQRWRRSHRLLHQTKKQYNQDIIKGRFVQSRSW